VIVTNQRNIKFPHDDRIGNRNSNTNISRVKVGGIIAMIHIQTHKSHSDSGKNVK